MTGLERRRHSMPYFYPVYVFFDHGIEEEYLLDCVRRNGLRSKSSITSVAAGRSRSAFCVSSQNRIRHGITSKGRERGEHNLFLHSHKGENDSEITDRSKM